MATPYDNAVTRRDAILLELTTTTWGPDVSDQGRSINTGGYRTSLLQELQMLEDLILRLAGPFEVVTVAR